MEVLLWQVWHTWGLEENQCASSLLYMFKAVVHLAGVSQLSVLAFQALPWSDGHWLTMWPLPHSRGKDLGHGSAGVPAPREVHGWSWAWALCWLSPYLGPGWQLPRTELQRQHGMWMGVELGPERQVVVEWADLMEGSCFSQGPDHSFASKGGRFLGHGP